MCVYRDRNGAAAVSLLTWIMFTAANLATVSYSLTVSNDLVIAGVFALNAVFCFAITALVAARRLAAATRVAPARKIQFFPSVFHTPFAVATTRSPTTISPLMNRSERVRRTTRHFASTNSPICTASTKCTSR